MSLMIRLSLMMFLEYAVWGAWLPVAGKYLGSDATMGGLGFSGYQIGLILGLAGAIGAIFAPFIAGQIADRYFNTERFLMVMFILGGCIKWYTAEQTTFGAWLWLSIIYSIVYMPTIALTNSLAFAHLKDQEKQFPYVRVWGTVGWIVASWVFPWIWLQTDLKFTSLPPFLVGAEVDNATSMLKNALKFSGMISIAFGIYCLCLPNTPPKRDAVSKLAFAKAFALFKNKSFTILVLASLPISIIHQIYFFQTGLFFADIGLQVSNIGPAMTIGQVAEIAVLAPLGFMLAKFGSRKVIFLGCMGYFARYIIFGTVSLPLELIVVSQALHGICFACFFAAAFIYVETIAAEDIRHSAQTVFGIILLGIGPILSGNVYGLMMGQFSSAHSFAEAQQILIDQTQEGETRTLILTAQQGKLQQTVNGFIEGNKVNRDKATGDEKQMLEADYLARKELLTPALEPLSAAAEAFKDNDRSSAVIHQEKAQQLLSEAQAKIDANKDWQKRAIFKFVDYAKFWYTMAIIGLVTGVFFLIFFRDETRSAKEAGGGEGVEDDSEAGAE